MGEVHRIHPENFEDANAIAIRLEQLTLRLSFLEKIAGWSDNALEVSHREYRATIAAVSKEAHEITEQIGDML